MASMSWLWSIIQAFKLLYSCLLTALKSRDTNSLLYGSLKSHLCHKLFTMSDYTLVRTTKGYLEHFSYFIFFFIFSHFGWDLENHLKIMNSLCYTFLRTCQFRGIFVWDSLIKWNQFWSDFKIHMVRGPIHQVKWVLEFLLWVMELRII